MKKFFRSMSAILLILIFSTSSLYAAPLAFSPQTSYAQEFLLKCEEQQWFIEEIERLLNLRQKSAYTLKSRDDLAGITALGLAGKDIEGRLPEAIGELYNLRFLYLSQNRLEGELPQSLFTLANLENLDLSENQLTGSLPPEIGQLKKLRVLLLWGNSFTGEIPAEIGELTALENLDLAENTFDGLSSDLNRLTKLKFLSLSGNSISSPLLPDLNSLGSIKTLNLSNCHFSGALPSLNRLTVLEILDLSGNEFTGGFPDEAASLPCLEVLELSGNSLEGSIPDVFSGFPKLKEMNLSNNLFVGDIPNSLITKSSQGASIDLAYNFLSGNNINTFPNNEGNLIDESGSPQFYLTMPEYTNVRLGQSFSVLDYLSLLDRDTQNVKADKLPPPSAYTCSIDPADQPSSQIVMETDAEGNILITPTWYIPPNMAIQFKLYITANEGSDFSTAFFKIYSPQPLENDYENNSIKPKVSLPASAMEEETDADAKANEKINTEADSTQLSAILHSKYINGYPDGTFKPDHQITREEFASILYSIEKDKEAAEYLEPSFPDIDKNGWSAGYIAYVQAKGYMAGYPDGLFHPKNPLTRAEFATVISHYKGLTASSPAYLTDIQSHWAFNFITAVNSASFMTGYPDLTFQPDKPITRAEVVSTINRVLGRTPDVVTIQAMKKPFSDIDNSHWAYQSVLEAAIEHYANWTENTEHWQTVTDKTADQ